MIFLLWAPCAWAYLHTPPRMPFPRPAWNETVHSEPFDRRMVAKYEKVSVSGAKVMLLEFPPQQYRPPGCGWSRATSILELRSQRCVFSERGAALMRFSSVSCSGCVASKL